MHMLNGKVAVVTGGTRGFGLSIARTLAQAGAAVVVASRSQISINEAVTSFTSENDAVTGLAADVAKLDQVQALARHALASFGRLDIWVNNAGTAGPYGPTAEVEPEDFLQVIQTNILGVFNGSHTAMQYFLPQKSGKLINLLGYGYNRPIAWQNAYSASKAWVRSFTIALAKETKDSGIGVFAFNPGMVLTELLTNLQVIEGSEDRLKVYPTIVRILAKPPEVPAKKVAWIASDATDGKSGKLYNTSSFGSMLLMPINEGIRALRHKPAPDMGIKINVIPPYKK